MSCSADVEYTSLGVFVDSNHVEVVQSIHRFLDRVHPYKRFWASLIIFSVWNAPGCSLAFLVNFSAPQVKVGLEVHTQKGVRVYVDVQCLYALSFLISI